MEKSSRFISLSGWSGILAGFYALIGAYAARIYYFEHQDDYGERISEFIGGPSIFSNIGFYEFFILDAGLVVLLSVITGALLTFRRAKKKGQKVWDKVAMRMIINLMIPLVTGGLFCIMLLKYGAIGLIAPSMLIFYGLALINASKYTLQDVKFFGAAELILGLCAMYFIGHGLIFWAIGFGLFHIIYGIVMWYRYERNQG